MLPAPEPKRRFGQSTHAKRARQIPSSFCDELFPVLPRGTAIGPTPKHRSAEQVSFGAKVRAPVVRGVLVSAVDTQQFAAACSQHGLHTTCSSHGIVPQLVEVTGLRDVQRPPTRKAFRSSSVPAVMRTFEARSMHTIFWCYQFLDLPPAALSLQKSYRYPPAWTLHVPIRCCVRSDTLRTHRATDAASQVGSVFSSPSARVGRKGWCCATGKAAGEGSACWVKVSRASCEGTAPSSNE